MSFILVTNDDGYDSPSLVPLIQALSALGPVRAVVPAGERSWIGKAITRFEDVEVTRADREGCEIWKATGFPADCTQLGIHALFDERPDLVVSGINVGFNHGLAFFCSSGTVGGAIEGWIAGIPSLAFSTGVLEGHDRWSVESRTPEGREGWTRAAALALDVTHVARKHGLPANADLVSVNLPWGSGVDTPREVTRLGRVGYHRVFQPRAVDRGEGLYFHEFGGMVRREKSLRDSEVVAARRGVVSITPVRLAHTADLTSEEVAAWEGRSPER
jgi:5'-nucleotidase